MIETLRALRKKCVIGFVGGSDLVKITEQLQVTDTNGASLRCENTLTKCPVVLDDFDFAFAENGLTAYKMGKALPSESCIHYIGEERWKKMVNFILHYIADLDIPIKR